MTKTSFRDAKPRVLVSGHLPPPMGGIATYYQSLLNSSLSQQVDLDFVETSSQKRTGAQSGTFSFSNLISAIDDCVRFTKAVIKHHPQLTHVATTLELSFLKHSVCVVMARLFGSRVLLHPHCGFPAMYTDQSRWWQWFFRQVIRLTNGVIVLSTEWNQLNSIVPSCPVYYLPNAIDLSAYRSLGSARIAAAKNLPQLKVLYLGYLGKSKGSFDLLEAARESMTRNLPVIFDLVGEDVSPGEVEQIKKQIGQTGLGNIVTLHPTASDTKKIDFFREADIFIYPSYSEGMPIAVIEAMACGLPVIASIVGGLPDLVKDGYNGILVDAGRPDQLVGALESLCLKPDLRKSMQVNGYQRAFDEYEIEKHVLQLVGIYRKTLGIA